MKKSDEAHNKVVILANIRADQFASTLEATDEEKKAVRKVFAKGYLMAVSDFINK